MPRMGDDISASTLVKLLLIGDGKLGKTYYAAQAAKAGFNLLYLDGDVGSSTIASMAASGALTKEEANRIYLLDVRDTILGGVRDSKMVEFMNDFTSSAVLKWNDSEQRIAKRTDIGDIWTMRPARLGQGDVLVIDSWTAYTESVMLWAGRANGVNVADATTAEMRPVYQGGALKATEMLQFIRSMPCHVIVIAHPDEYTHTTNPEGRKAGSINEKDKIVDWTKMIPKTTSKPQGLQMAKYFSDVAWMELSPAGDTRRLNFKPRNDRVCGGHFFDSKSTDDYSFANLIKAIGGKLPEGDNEPGWLTIEHIDQPVQVESQVLDGTKPAPVMGLSGLMQKK